MAEWKVRWGRCTARRKAAWASLMLIAAVAALYGLTFAVLPLTGHSLVLRDDNFEQHYPFLIAIGRWLRAFVRNPRQAGWFDWTLGMGADGLGSLNYYGAGDPLLLLAALFEGASTYAGYVLLTALRHVLAGLAFLALARGFGIRWKHALIGAVSYAFTNYMIAWCTLIHPMFANPVIHLPLMVLGCEKRFRGGPPWMLMLSTAWSALCGFYFLYMNSLMLLLFAVVRWAAVYRKKIAFFAASGRALLPYALGLLLAAPVLLPAVLTYLDSARAGGTAQALLLAEPDVCWAWPISFISSNGWNNAMTVPVAAMFALAALWRDRSRRALGICCALAMIALLIPAVGVVFNGFSYSTDRWKYGGLLLLTFAFAQYMGHVERGAAGRWMAVVWLVWSAVLALRWKLRGAAVPHPMLILLAALLAAAGLAYLALAKRLSGTRAATALLAAFVAGNLLVNGFVICFDHVLGGEGAGSAWERRSQTTLWAAADDGARADLTDAEYFRYNAPAVAGRASTSVYMSMQPSATVDFLRELEVSTMVNPNRTFGVNGRAALEALYAVTELTAPSGRPAPYGFSLAQDDGSTALWRNDFAPKIAWTAFGRIPENEYAAMNPLEKQWALLQGAVSDAASVPEIEPAQTAGKDAWRVTSAENAGLSDEELWFGEGGGWVEVTVEGVPDSEVYLRLLGVTEREAPDQAYLTLASGDAAALIILPSDRYNYSLRRRDFTTCAGMAGGEGTVLRLSCGQQATYRLEGVEVWCQPMADFAGLMQARSEDVAAVSGLSDRITAQVAMPEAGLVCFSVPAVRGWRAEVDGHPAGLLANADALWMVEVPAGEHSVELIYVTPGLRPGLALAIAAALFAAGWALFRRKREGRAA